ncbi:hypothetical protein ACEZDB_15480 [Streptacidiphilus sp. N1-3]|uniref:Uncharacterized protein n=1 Tax=Streptacidiphilus alkalitolerans TaxID=3342712 RepID=A0ABV6X1H5_9ACTN
MSEQSTAPRRAALVEISAFHTDTRYRLVRMGGLGWSPMSAHEFEDSVRAAFPDIDLEDPAQVDWSDRPWQWPR